MKRFLMLILSLSMAFALCACGEEAPAPAAAETESESQALDIYDEMETGEYVRETMNEPAPAPTDNLPEPEIVENGFKVAEQDGKFGFVNESGEPEIAYEFDDAKNFVNGYAAVCQGGKWGIINEECAFVVKCEFEEVSRFVSEGFVAVKQDGKWGYYDIEMNGVIIAAKFDEAGAFQNGKARVVIDGQEAYVARPY